MKLYLLLKINKYACFFNSYNLIIIKILYSVFLSKMNLNFSKLLVKFYDIKKTKREI